MYVCSSSLEMTIRLSTRIAQGAPGSPGSHGGGSQVALGVLEGGRGWIDCWKSH